MRKIIAYSLLLGTFSLTAFSREQLKPVVKPAVALSTAGALYAAGIWFAGQTLVDTGLRYIELKEIYANFGIRMFLIAPGLLTDKEIKFWSCIQALSAVPQVYWRELISTAITIGLFYAGTRCIKKAYEV